MMQISDLHEELNDLWIANDGLSSGKERVADARDLAIQQGERLQQQMELTQKERDSMAAEQKVSL